jgi:putative aldouronate transport system permease protein
VDEYMNRKSTGRDKVFDIIIMVIVGIIAFCFLIPLLNVLSSSFSSADAVLSGKVGLFPVDFDLSGYKTVINDSKIWNGFKNSLIYTLIGTIIQVTCQMLCAYPLARKDFKGRKFINLFLVLTMFISGGMIPSYLLVTGLHIDNTIWAIILPGCISVFNIIVIRTYIESSISMEVQEAAMIDGCGDVQIFTRIVLPLCRPIIAVMILYGIVGYWNSYFNALMYVNDQSLMPLQNVLNDILISNEASLGGGVDVSAGEQLKYVAIVVSSLPLLVIYPFFQKYFEKGVTIGGIKG